MDDVNWQALPDPIKVNGQLLGVAGKFHVQFGLFVIGRNAESDTGQRIARSWLRPGHLTGNHTYAYRSYGNCSFEEFSADMPRAEKVLAGSLNKPHFFRFPQLKEGDTAQKRDQMRGFLAARGYRKAISERAPDY